MVIGQVGREEATRRRARPDGVRRGPLAGLVRLFPSPSIDGNPVLWYEWHRQRPSRWSVAVWGLFALLASGFSLWAILDAFSGSSAGQPRLGRGD